MSTERRSAITMGEASDELMEVRPGIRRDGGELPAAHPLGAKAGRRACRSPWRRSVAVGRRTTTQLAEDVYRTGPLGGCIARVGPWPVGTGARRRGARGGTVRDTDLVTSLGPCFW